jgi:hypothetical protein
MTVEFALAGSGAIEGTVIDLAGQPVAGTEVKLVATMTTDHGNGSPPHLKTSTGDDGHYRLDHVPEGRYLVQVGTDLFSGAFALESAHIPMDVQARVWAAVAEVPAVGTRATSGLAPRWIPDVLVKTGQATRLDVTLDPGATIEGRITDASGTPLGGAKVKLERVLRWPAPDQQGSSTSYDGTTTISSKGHWDGGASETVLSTIERAAVTGEDGRYRFETLIAGEKLLKITDGSAHLAPQERTLTVFGTTLYAGVDFVLTAGLVVQGRVTDPAGNPLHANVIVQPAGTSVFTADGQVATDDDGRFAVAGLAAGKHSLNISASGYAHAFHEMEAGDPERTFVLTPSPKLHGAVSDAVTGAPVVRFALRLAVPNTISVSGDDDHAGGIFSADMNDDEPVEVTVTAVGYEPVTVQGVIPSTTSPEAPLRFRLVPH